MTLLKSPRGLPLVLSARPPKGQVLTVECCSKWYSLFLVWPTDAIDVISFDALDRVAADLDVTPYVDHVPNPAAVRAYAESRGWLLDDCAEDMLLGRWARDVIECECARFVDELD